MRSDHELAGRVAAAHFKADLRARIVAIAASLAAGGVVIASDLIRTGSAAGPASVPATLAAGLFAVLLFTLALEGAFTIVQAVSFLLMPVRTPGLYGLVPVAAVVAAVGLPVAQTLETAPQGGWFWVFGGAAGLLCGAALFFLAPFLRGRHGGFLILAAVAARFLSEPFARSAAFLPVSGFITLLFFIVLGIRQKLEGAQGGSSTHTPPQLRWAARTGCVILAAAAAAAPDFAGDWILPCFAFLFLVIVFMEMLLHGVSAPPGRNLIAAAMLGSVVCFAGAGAIWLLPPESKAGVVRFGNLGAEGLTIHGAFFGPGSASCGTMCNPPPVPERIPGILPSSFFIVTTDAGSWKRAGWNGIMSHNVFLPSPEPEFYPFFSRLTDEGYRTICAGRIPEGAAPGCQVLRRGSPAKMGPQIRKYRETRTAVWLHAPGLTGEELRSLYSDVLESSADSIAFVAWTAPAGLGRFQPDPGPGIVDVESFAAGFRRRTHGNLDESHASHTWVRDWKKNRGTSIPLISTSTKQGIGLTDPLTGAQWQIPWAHSD